MVSALDIPSVREATVPISVEQYHALTDSGKLTEAVELLWGVIVKKMAKSPLHTLIARRLYDQLSALLGANCHCRMEQPLTLEDSEPEPDLAVVDGSPEDYLTAHPGTASFVAEIAISTVDLDRVKANAYATAGIPEYWLVRPEDGLVECFSRPVGGAYRETKTIDVKDQRELLCSLGTADLEALFHRIDWG